jgi:CelD/BcsL family acetyltransferase involved in cellulose biosynthesis
MTYATSLDSTRANAGAGTSDRSRLRVRPLDRAGILALPAEQWDALVQNSVAENPFLDRRQVVAALETVDRGKELRGLAFNAPDGTLVGLFLHQPRSKVPTPFRVANSLANDYLLNGTPLIHKEHAEAVVGAWLDAVKTGAAPGLWVLDDIDVSAPLIALIRQGAEARGITHAEANPYGRAYLTRLEGGFEAHLGEVLSKNRLKDVRRTMRRLGEVGQITLEHAEDPALLAQRLEEFLALEHAGWKGEMGTSFLSHAADAAFARAAYQPGLATISSLLLDGKPIAMKLAVRTGRVAHTPKIAYDETYRKLGPGMALEYLLIEDFYATDRMDAVDAAATAEGHSALNFFNTEKPMATFILGRHGWQVRLLARLHEGREALKLQVKATKEKIAAWRAGKQPVPPKPADPA